MNRRRWLYIGMVALLPTVNMAADTPTKPVRIIAFGDSLTAGYNLVDPDTEAWPALLEKKLRAAGFSVEVVNAGQSGDTTSEALNRLDFTLSQGGDIVIVAFGSNDTFQGKSLKNIEKNLNEIIRRIKAKKMDVVLCAMKTFPNFGPDYAQAYEKIFPRVAVKQNVPLIPFILKDVAGHGELNSQDSIHPNAAGYKIVVENIYPTIENILKSKGR